MSTGDCLRLRDAFLEAARRTTRVIVLTGGTDFWSNGIHLNCIEAAESPADESWANINAMDDLCKAVLECGTQLTVAAMCGNAGAGGVFLALAADRVLARSGIVLNPHYRGMGNLYGSEYWTYLLPGRVGEQRAQAMELAAREDFDRLLALKLEARERDERRKPLETYREEELERMRLDFYGFDPSYHVARYHFVHRVPHAWTPLHLAPHRRNLWRNQASLAARSHAGENSR